MRIHLLWSHFPGLAPVAVCFLASVVLGGSHAEDARQLTSCRYAEVTQETSHIEGADGALQVKWIAKVNPVSCSLDSFRKRIWTSRLDGVQLSNLKAWQSTSNDGSASKLEEMIMVAKSNDCTSGELCFVYDVQGTCGIGVSSCGSIEFPLATPVTADGELTVKVTYILRESVCINSRTRKAHLSMAWTSHWGAWKVNESIYRLCTYHPDAPENGYCEAAVSPLRPRPCLSDLGLPNIQCGHSVKVPGRLFSVFFEWYTASSKVLGFCDSADRPGKAIAAPSTDDTGETAKLEERSTAPLTVGIAAFGSSIIFAGVVCLVAHKAPVKRAPARQNTITISKEPLEKLKNKLSFPDDSSDSTVASLRESPKHRLRLNGGATPKSRASPAIAIGRDLEAARDRVCGLGMSSDRELSSPSRNLQDALNASVDEEEEDAPKRCNSISSDHVDIDLDQHKEKSDKWAAEEEGSFQAFYSSLSPDKMPKTPVGPCKPTGQSLPAQLPNPAQLPSVSAAIGMKAFSKQKNGLAPKQHSQSSNWDVMSEGSVKPVNNSHRPNIDNAAIAFNALRDIHNAALPKIQIVTSAESAMPPPTSCVAPRNESRKSNWDAMSDASIDVAHTSNQHQLGASMLMLPATKGVAPSSDSRNSNWDAMSDGSAADLPSSALNQGSNGFSGSDKPQISTLPPVPVAVAAPNLMHSSKQVSLQTLGEGRVEEKHRAVFLL